MEAHEENWEADQEQKGAPISEDLSTQHSQQQVPPVETEDQNRHSYNIKEQGQELKRNANIIEDDENQEDLKSPKPKDKIVEERKDSSANKGTSEIDIMGGRDKDTDISEKHMRRTESSKETGYSQTH
ncbi:hypothetical protein O6H91_22G013700 [Diphasiastrum complanatum]|uniref:Uncharacterized protein n=1 Tax=Diphasiastrum complanatum TaxID=34168 RepID=A0ACC2AD11_DIPCM|nr:hypothetical protein O6H91_22G013700 [Diphasiastrum complanatum]